MIDTEKPTFSRTKIEQTQTLTYHVSSVFSSSLISQLTAGTFFILSIITILFRLSVVSGIITILFGTLLAYILSLILVSALISYEDTKAPLSKEQRMVFKFDFFYHLLLARLAAFNFLEFSEKLSKDKEDS